MADTASTYFWNTIPGMTYFWNIPEPTQPGVGPDPDVEAAPATVTADPVPEGQTQPTWWERVRRQEAAEPVVLTETADCYLCARRTQCTRRAASDAPVCRDCTKGLEP